MMSHPTRLAPQQLSAPVTASQFPFATTEKLKPYLGILGQERAVTAIQFGVAMQQTGYNIFVMGDEGSGRASFINEFLLSEGKRQPTPSDFLFVNNFDNPRRPLMLELPAGTAARLKSDIDQLISSLLDTFPAAFEHPSYQQQKAAIERAFNRQYDQVIDGVEKEAITRNVALYRDASTVSFTPMLEGRAMEETEFSQLPEEARELFHQHINELEEMLNTALLPLPQWKRESSEQFRKLTQQTIARAIAPLLDPLEKRYRGIPCLLAYLKRMRKQLHRMIPEKLIDEKSQEMREAYESRLLLEEELSPNIMVSREPSSGAPVVHEPHPSYKNLFGRVEFTGDMSAINSSYRQLCGGSLHRANGGFLVIEAEKLLQEPFAWDALKRAIKERRLQMESPYSEMGIVNSITLDPEPIPLHTKIVLIGNRSTYYLLQQLDSDFSALFRVLADFDDRIHRDDESLAAFARLMQTFSAREQFALLSADAVARLVEYSCRLAEHQQYLSAQFNRIFNLLGEADFVRRLANDKVTHAQHIERALKAQQERSNRVSELQLEQLNDGTVLINTEGASIGKINALTVYQLGDNQFGTPARITATVFPGSRGVVDIEREVSLGQALHSKGVMILSGYLGQRYARHFPLAISANLAMEQSYGLIDGDSASLAELCCLLSAITEVPIQQSLAITGSVNQYGEVQAIGGVNEKIEGFFDLCKVRGLTGKQGVIIPRANRINLMLRQEVIEAVAANRFHIFAVAEVDQAMELLTGIAAGSASGDQPYPEGSINALAIGRLQEISACSHRRTDATDATDDSSQR
ncbi:Lon protease family protein [Aestuariirhabdus litorea]|uniref:endopeptidase La n=1 Tax=Aestuariirhabdus litorea TaxID=2528527 RepID=A0A3P3VNL2_9GAMM|nr:ATP-binding protein [Aestuariirhabdus litorea]RRJ83236.1 ATP-binding protein [Aestuariirhabdus litorea]RWW93393.1 ATP-binding protein [Endozoicomonadaceae bacterium GTF-13]